MYLAFPISSASLLPDGGMQTAPSSNSWLGQKWIQAEDHILLGRASTMAASRRMPTGAGWSQLISALI